MAGDAVAVDSRHQRDGIVVFRLTERWQRLNHKPAWIVGVLDSHLGACSLCCLLAFLVDEERSEVEVLLALLRQCDGQGACYEFAVA